MRAEMGTVMVVKMGMAIRMRTIAVVSDSV